MRITIHGEQIPIPLDLARHARGRLTDVLARRAGSIRGVVLRLVRPAPGQVPNWIVIVDLGSHGTAVTRVSASVPRVALDVVCERVQASVEQRLSSPMHAHGRVTRIYA